MHPGLPLHPNPVQASPLPDLQETFGPFAMDNLPLLILAAALVVLVIVAIVLIAAQLRRTAGRRPADTVAGQRPGAAPAAVSNEPRKVAVGGGGSLRQFREVLVEAQSALERGGNSGDGIVHCWLSLERGVERAGFRTAGAGNTAEATAAFLQGLHPDRSDIQTLLRLYHWATSGVTEHQRRISPAELGAAKSALASLRTSVDARLAAAGRD